MRANRRCGAKTKRGTSCQAPAIAGKKWCRIHGGAKGSGTPKGNQNALKTGFYTREAIQERREMFKVIREMHKQLKDVEKLI
jgi:glucans biosynthesis protein